MNTISKLFFSFFLLAFGQSTRAQWTDISIPEYFYVKDVHFIGHLGFALSGAQSLGESAVFCKTTDYGMNWTSSTPDYMNIINPPDVADWSDFGDDLTITFTGEAMHFFNEQEALISLTVLVEIPNPISGVSFSRTIKTVDGGNSWTEVQQTTLSTGFTQFVQYSASGIIVHRHGDILRSDDKGDTWTQIFDYSMGWDFDFRHIVLGPDNKLYAAVNTGTIMVSEDEGTSWTEAFEGFPMKNCIDFDFASDDEILASVLEVPYGPFPEVYYYHSVDSGDSWDGTSIGFSQVAYANNSWYGQTGSTISASADAESWTDVFTSPEGESISELGVYNNAVYVAGWNGLIYTNFDINSVAVNELSTALPFEIYPNPSSDLIHIKSEKEISVLSVYNTDGKQMLVSKEKSFSLASFPAAQYYIHIKWADGSEHSQSVVKQ